MKLKGTSLKWRLCLKMLLFLFPVHLRSEGTRPFRSVKHFFTNHNIILGSSSSSCRKGCCFFEWDFQQLGGSLTAVVMSCSQFLWESFTCLWWKREPVPHLPTLYVQTVVTFSYDVSDMHCLIQYSQDELPDFLITCLFWTPVWQLMINE